MARACLLGAFERVRVRALCWRREVRCKAMLYYADGEKVGVRTAVVMACVASGALLSFAWYLSFISSCSVIGATVLCSPTERHCANLCLYETREEDVEEIRRSGDDRVSVNEGRRVVLTLCLARNFRSLGASHADDVVPHQEVDPAWGALGHLALPRDRWGSGMPDLEFRRAARVYTFLLLLVRASMMWRLCMHSHDCLMDEMGRGCSGVKTMHSTA